MIDPYKFLEKVCGALDLSVLYEDRSGVKSFNQIYRNDIFKPSMFGKEFMLNAEQLFLGIDGLKDSFSHLFTPVVESPHFSLMKILDQGEDTSESTYYTLQANGRLDMRRGNKKTISAVTFESKKKLVKENRYEPVIVYYHLDRFFIADGKHRAALCASMGQQVRCISNDHIKYDSYFSWIARKMASSNFELYQKHLAFFQSYLHI